MGSNRKIIQITTGVMGILALCDDGTVWVKAGTANKWAEVEIESLNTPPFNAPKITSPLVKP